jgi:hypothetical protein
MSNLKILKFEKPAKEDAPGIFEELKGRKFMAVSVSAEDDESKTFKYHVNHMSAEEAIYACNLMINAVLNGDME